MMTLVPCASVAGCFLSAAFVPDPLPSGESLFQRFAEKTGAIEAQGRIHNRRMVGTFAQQEGVPGVRLEIISEEPALRHATVRLNGVDRVFVTGKEFVWNDDGTTFVVAGEAEHEQSQNRAAFHAAALWAEQYDSIACVGVSDVNGRDAYRVECRSRLCEPIVHYFDVDSGLLSRTEADVISGQRSYPTVSTFSDYKEVDGVLIATRMHRTLSAASEQFYRFDTIEHNIQIPDGLFVLDIERKRPPGWAHDLPAARDVQSHHVKASGGPEAIRGDPFAQMTGTFDAQPGQAAVPITTWQTEGFYHVATSLGGAPAQSTVNGEFAWRLMGIERTILEGDELAQALTRSTMHPFLEPEKIYRSSETIGLDTLDGRPVYKVSSATYNCDRITEYFDTETGLLLCTELDTNYAGVLIPTRVVIGGYRDFDGVMVPTLMHRRLDLPGGNVNEQVYRFDTVEHNLDIPAAVMMLPEELRPGGQG